MAIADLHGFLPGIPPCELLLVGGDLCPLSRHGADAQRAWLRGPFADWLATVEAGPQPMRSLP